jgi:hypothetical protein
MLFERQRLLLTLLDTVGAPVGHTDFQKLLFLYTHGYETTPSYDFVPYRFGAFSFTSYAAMRKLIAAGLLVEDERHWTLTDGGCEVARRQAVEPLRVASFCREHSFLRGNALIVEQYLGRKPELIDYFAPHGVIRIPPILLFKRTCERLAGNSARDPGWRLRYYERNDQVRHAESTSSMPRRRLRLELAICSETLQKGSPKNGRGTRQLSRCYLFYIPQILAD